ncbi:type II secretion system F family protein [Pseudonocardia sp. KRD291]|uniref:type II secretion system F family protein n=1 Tax=Pseudonocardia sp. KRD291 TaxID=2792007 RepID=UPI001C4A166F|nr:type II secretion system F family protein [Pseudonocardia sp. KRD291]MBW0101923.1 type II secretion system F family protein [Pseudonocardia sp. KRD291]
MNAFVPALLAGALLLAGARTGPARLNHLSGGDPGTAPPDGAVRTRWVVVGALAAAAAVWAVVGGTGGLVTGVGVGTALVVAARRLAAAAGHGRTDTADLAAAWDLLSVCLRVGLAVPVAVEAAAQRLPGAAGAALRRTSGLLALGAGAEQAWEATAPLPELAAFGRAASRSAATGAALRRTADAEAARLRAELADLAEAKAQRAAVRITAPLGLCFLPAFLVLGIAPVVIGLAGEAFARW